MPKRAEKLLTTRVDCGIETRGVVLTGHLSRTAAIQAARAHYQKELRRIQIAIEALDANRVRVSYQENGQRTENYRPTEVDAPEETARQIIASTV